MSQVSRPMQVALAATLLFALVWFVALRPKPAGGGESAAAPAPAPAAQATPAAPGTEGLTSAVDEAKGAVATADGDAQRADQSSADGGGTSGADAQTGSTAPAGPAQKAERAAGAAGGGTAAPDTAAAESHAARAHAGSPQVRAVRTALRRHKAVAIAFVDPHTADARAVADEVRRVSRFGGRAVALAVPLAQLSDFAFITNTVEVTVAPTVVIVDPRRRAGTIVGFADRGEIEQRLADALAVGPRR